MSIASLQKNHTEDLTMSETPNHHCFHYFDLLTRKILVVHNTRKSRGGIERATKPTLTREQGPQPMFST